MPRGKGNKLYDIRGKKLAAREEFMAGLAVVPKGGALLLWTGEQAEDPGVGGTEGIPGPTRAARQRSAAGLAPPDRPPGGAPADGGLDGAGAPFGGAGLAKTHETSSLAGSSTTAAPDRKPKEQHSFL